MAGTTTKITVSIPKDLKDGLQNSIVPTNLSKVVTAALDIHLKSVEDGVYWGQEYASTATLTAIEDIADYPLSADRMKSSTEPAYVVFAKRVWLGKKPDRRARESADKFGKWLEYHKLRERASNPDWMAGFCKGVELMYTSKRRKRLRAAR